MFCVDNFFFSSRACPKNTKATFWLDSRRGHIVRFLGMHMWPHQRWLEFVLSQLPLPQFQLLVSILHMKLKHLPPYWFIFMTHIYNGYFTKKKVWERALPTLSLSTQGWFSAAAAAGSCWGCKCGAENLAQCLLPFWGTHHLMKLTTSHIHKRLFQTHVWQA